MASGYLTGKLLIASPYMEDKRFEKSLIYVCGHDKHGAMGLMINKRLHGFKFHDLIDQLDLSINVNLPVSPHPDIFFGGPVDSERGFILHSDDYHQSGSLPIQDNITLTASTEILESIANGDGPENYLLILGYAGWGSGQLDTEIEHNGWLHVDPDEKLLFGGNTGNKWESALKKLGVPQESFSQHAGHA